MNDINIQESNRVLFNETQENILAAMEIAKNHNDKETLLSLEIFREEVKDMLLSDDEYKHEKLLNVNEVPILYWFIIAKQNIKTIVDKNDISLLFVGEFNKWDDDVEIYAAGQIRKHKSSK